MFMKRTLCMILAVMVMVSLEACGGTTPAATSATATTAATSVAATTAATTAAATTTAEATAAATTAAATPVATPEVQTFSKNKDKIVTLQYFARNSPISGVIENLYWSDIIKKDLGIVLELMPAGDQSTQKYDALLASGSMPDLVFVSNYDQITNAVKANLLVNLDDYQDKLPNAYKNSMSSIQYFRDNVSNNTGKCYSLGAAITSSAQNSGSTNEGPYTRWDYYKELGMPKIATLEDYLPFLKKMLDAHPKNDDGQPRVGISIFKDWDSLTMSPAEWFLNSYGYGTIGFVEVDYSKNELKSIFDSNSMYTRALKFYFTANQMGLLDPDSVSQRFSDYMDKGTAGKTLFSWWSWGFGGFNTADRQAKNIGFNAVFPEDVKQFNWGYPNYVGNVGSYAIGKDTKNLDRCLEFLDYLYNPDGVWRLYNGEQGVYWDVGSDGKPYVTEQGWKIVADGNKMPGGGLLGDGVNTSNGSGINRRCINPTLGFRIDGSDWIKKPFAPASTSLVIDWQKTMGAVDEFAFLGKTKRIVTPDFAPMGTIPDDVQQLNAKIGDYVKNMSWKIVLAKNEAEFNTLVKEMAETVTGMGVDKSVQWVKDDYKKGLEFASKYVKIGCAP